MIANTDAELVARVRRGDRLAAGELAGRYLRACRAVAIAVTGDVTDAEDVCQDAFVSAIEHIDDCRKPDRFGAWLMQIVRNRARNHLRDQPGRRTVPLESVTLGTNATSPAREAERAELRNSLLSALNEIPAAHREVVLLHDLEGWTHREIAEQMELPPGTVRSHLHHARKRLRALLGHFGEGEE